MVFPLRGKQRERKMKAGRGRKGKLYKPKCPKIKMIAKPFFVTK
jgi:hypothetical protein